MLITNKRGETYVGFSVKIMISVILSAAVFTAAMFLIPNVYESGLRGFLSPVNATEAVDHPVPAEDAVESEAVTEGDAAIWQVTPAGVLEKYKGPVVSDGSELFIPEKVGGITVKTLGGGEPVFFDERIGPLVKAGSIRIPNTVTAIGDLALSLVEAHMDIEIPGSVKTVGFRAFYDSSFERIVFCSGLSSLGEKCFESGLNLPSCLRYIDLPGTLEGMPANVFEGVTTLQLIIFRQSDAPWQQAATPGGVTKLNIS